MSISYNAHVPVSAALDALGLTQSCIIARGLQQWEALGPPIDGWPTVLALRPTHEVAWADPATILSGTTRFFASLPAKGKGPQVRVMQLSESFDVLSSDVGSILVRLKVGFRPLRPPEIPSGVILCSRIDNVVGWFSPTILPWWPY